MNSLPQTGGHPLETRLPRVDSLTGLRWWAAFGVFFFHMSAFAPLPAPITGLAELGHFGVTFFFVLSGFVLVLSARPGTPNSTFFWRRFARIYPSHLVALIIAIPVFYSFAPLAAQWWVKPFEPGTISLSLFLLQGWSRDTEVLFSGNPAAWTLTCELFFYAIFPFVLKFLARLRVRGALIATAGVIALTAAIGVGTLLWPSAFAIVPWPILRTPEFLLGMTLAWAVRCGWRPRLIPLPMVIIGTGIFALMLAYPHKFSSLGVLPMLAGKAANEGIILLCALMILVATVADLQGRRTVLRNPVLVRLGEWSYAFYLVHATIMYAIFAIVGPQTNGWGNWPWYLLVFVLAVALAGVVHHGVEAPAERRLRKWKDDRDTRRATRSSGDRVAKS